MMEWVREDTAGTWKGESADGNKLIDEPDGWISETWGILTEEMGSGGFIIQRFGRC